MLIFGIRGEPLSSFASAYRRYTIPDAFDDEACTRLSTTSVPFRASAVQHDGPPTEALRNARSSTCVELPHDGSTDWFFTRLQPHIERINMRSRFEICGYSAPQLLKYEEGQQYAWHVDLGRDSLATRKLSVILLLSEPDDYGGGDLEWMPDLGPCPRARGTLIVFPSFMPHRVTPVTWGRRLVLVTWVHGDHPFR